MIDLDTLADNIEYFEKKIDYTFKNKKNILLALTHSSYANERKAENLHSNERLEFLGDAVLNVVISENIYTKYPHLTEGEMTKARANIVCEMSLIKCANNIEIGKYLLLGKGEEITGGRERISILSDAFEALIGAIYIDSGMESAKKFIHQQMKQLIVNSINGMNCMDYKTQLQEVIQKSSDNKITYEIIEEKGPDHNKVFVSQVKISDKVMGIGKGKSKKEAEQNAAKTALQKDGEF
ncbi:MAG: ribonuclease III [Clostridia bacterium]|nr:ribonuclease III [Clostridia bacterium]